MIFRRQAQAQPLADELEQLVALAVAETLVDVLEVIQVEQQQGAAGPVAATGLLGCLLETLAEQQAIGQRGQGVVIGEEVDLALGIVDRADVGEDRDQMGQGAVLVAHAADRLPQREDFAVLRRFQIFTGFRAALLGQALPDTGIESLRHAGRT